jgi:hypothetical protein
MEDFNRGVFRDPGAKELVKILYFPDFEVSCETLGF